MSEQPLATMTMIYESEMPKYLEQLDKATRDWTMQAARGECSWVCADCCYTFPSGMPDACVHDCAACTDIIRRDKREAMLEGTEPI